MNQILEAKIGAIAELMGKGFDETVDMLLERAVEGASSVMAAQYTANFNLREQKSLASGAGGDTVKLADSIRKHALTFHIEPARKNGSSQIKIRAGDVHRELGLRNRLPAVCAALGSNIFARVASVRALPVSGPANGANTEFTFEL